MPFDDEQKAELKEIFGEFGKELLKEVDKKNSGLAASVQGKVTTAIEEFKTSYRPAESKPKGDEEKLTLKVLEGKIGTLEEQLDSRDREAVAAQRQASIVAAVADKKLEMPGRVATELISHYGSDKFASEGDQLFVTTATGTITIGDAIDEFAKTEFGRRFVPANVGGGTNSTTPPKRKENAGDHPTIDSLLADYMADPTLSS